MAIMTVIKCHMTASKYCNMGIKLTALIQLLQMNTKFSISNNWETKKPKSVMFKIFPFVLPFINRGSFGGPLKLIGSKIIENWWGFEHPSIS